MFEDVAIRKISRCVDCMCSMGNWQNVLTLMNKDDYDLTILNQADLIFGVHICILGRCPHTKYMYEGGKGVSP